MGSFAVAAWGGPGAGHSGAFAVPVIPAAPEPPMKAFGMQIFPGAGEFGDRGSFSDMPVPASLEEQRRWDAPAVRDFRRKLAPFLFINAVIIIADIVTSKNLTEVTVLYSIYMAYKYAKLWSNGYDWHDVFRQPREREIVDVVEDTVGYVKAMVNSQERTRRRNARQSRAMAARTSGSRQMPALPAGSFPARPPHTALPQVRARPIDP